MNETLTCLKRVAVPLSEQGQGGIALPNVVSRQRTTPRPDMRIFTLASSDNPAVFLFFLLFCLFQHDGLRNRMNVSETGTLAARADSEGTRL